MSLKNRSIPVLLCMPLALSACWGVRGNGERERETRAHDDFFGIESRGELEVQVRQSDVFRVAVSIDSNLLDNVKTRVRDDVLIIDNNVNLVNIVSGPHVIVDMPSLGLVQLLGSGNLEARGFDETDSLRIELNGSGDLSFEGSARTIDARLDGSGDLELVGSTDFIDIEVDGSGNVEARDLDAAAGRVQIDGSGDVAVTIHGKVDAELYGSGDLDLYGEVDLQRADEDGSGDLRVHD